nr:fructokinase-2 [Tanacetum cinerariifolium]
MVLTGAKIFRLCESLNDVLDSMAKKGLDHDQLPVGVNSVVQDVPDVFFRRKYEVVILCGLNFIKKVLLTSSESLIFESSVGHLSCSGKPIVHRYLQRRKGVDKIIDVAMMDITPHCLDRVHPQSGSSLHLLNSPTPTHRLSLIVQDVLQSKSYSLNISVSLDFWFQVAQLYNEKVAFHEKNKSNAFTVHLLKYKNEELMKYIERCQEFHGTIPAFSMKAMDTIDAYDSFIGALLTKIVDDQSMLQDEAKLKDILRYLCACGDIITTKKGATPSLPSVMEVHTFMDAQHS